MEKQKPRQKKKKDRIRTSHLSREIPDAPTLEEFECLLGESPTNYPRGEGIENMESELHSAAIDTEVYENENYKVVIMENDEIPTAEAVECTVHFVDEVDTGIPMASAPSEDVENSSELNSKLEEMRNNISTIRLIDTIPSAPIIENVISLPAQTTKLPSDKNNLKKEKSNLKSQTSTMEKSKLDEKTMKPFNETQLAALYNNQELSLVESFINEFVDFQLRGHSIRQQHRLQELVMSYLRVRNHLIVNSHELETLKKSCKDIQKQLWCLDKAGITEYGECQDGNPVSANHEYSVAHFNKKTLAALTKNLSAIKESLHNTHALYCYESETLKLQIEHYIQRVCISCKDFANLPQNAPISLEPFQISSHTMPQLVELRMCISILFYFQRRVLKDGKFVTDTRDWLSKLVAILLRVATWQDHLFLLNHVLRCPGGVTNWAKSFIQIPVPSRNRNLTSPLNDPHLDHIVSTLAVILLPIKERNQFLEQVQISLQETGNNNGDTVWVMLDEEGEEDEDIANCGANLFESDLISLLHQIPLDKLFEQVLFIERHNDNFHQDGNAVTEHHILRIFAFSTVIVRLLKKGLQTYDSPRYRQLAKRLSALIRDTVQYSSDLWELFDKTKITDNSMLMRIQLEYDYFFLRATLCIFSSRRLGAWQYLAAIPYHIVSSDMLWKIFYILHTDSSIADLPDFEMSQWETELNSPKIYKQFEEKLSNLPGDESYFLLTTFANMAMARTDDYEFVRATTIDLFQIGFLSKKTQDTCSKDARSLLSNLTDKYSSLLSDILLKLRDNFVSVGKLSLYLFTELRIEKWIPQNGDLNVISAWLHQYPLSSTESHLARLVLSHFNWGLGDDNNLHLPINVHRRIALLMVELSKKYILENPVQSASLLAEGVKQVSSIVRSQSNEQAFSQWVWEMVSRLRLNRLEESDAVSQYSIINPGEAFSHVPDLDSDPNLESLVIVLNEKQPLAAFVALRMTLLGHSIPLICSKGFEHLQILQSYHKYEQMLHVLHNIIPLFLNCSEYLLNNEKFLSLTIALITADRTYMKIAKNLIAPEFPGSILKLFSSMIESHLHNYKRYCLQTPEPFVRLWLNILILIPDWNRDQSVLYLLDTVIRASFFYIDARTTTEIMFQNLFSNLSCGKNSSSFGSFLNWAMGSSSCPSLLGGSIQSIWVAYIILYTEQYERELKTNLWKEILRELCLQTKTSLDSALKKAFATVKVQPFSANSLSIYRWSQQALDTPLDHPLLPLLWQNFFSLLLGRPPSSTGVIDHGGVGEKFFEGMINLSYLKKVKKRLHDTVEYFQMKAENDLDNGKLITDERRIFYLDMAKFYKTMTLWLEEPRLQESGLYLPALPPQYMSQKLMLLLQGDRNPWLEYVDYFSVQQSQQKAIQEWQFVTYQQVDCLKKFSQTPTTPLEPVDPQQRIFRRLNSYEQPVPSPVLNRNNPVIQPIPRDCLYNSDSIIKLIGPHFKIILDYAQTFNLMVSEHTAVDCSFLELVPTLYKEVENYITLHALCDITSSNQKRSRSGTPPIVHCAGPAVIRVKILEARVSDGVDEMISQNRAEYENLLVKASQPPPSKVTLGCVIADHLIALLEHELNLNRTTENTSILRKVQDSGVKLFYYLVELYSEEASLCPPTKQLITTCIEKLGQLFISGEESQGTELLKAIIERPNLGGLLGPHFTPVAGGASSFLQMYQIVVELSTGSNVDLCFVLLSKFDVGSWLNYRRPRLSERSTFIELVSRALCNIGLNPEEDKQILHELFRNHLRLVLLHEFPEHYGEVLSVILRGSEGQSLSLDVWRDLLGVLSGRAKSAPPMHVLKVRDEIRRYATEQKILSRQEMHDTAVLLSKHFMNERLQYGLYGLYPKYRVYNEPLTIFLGMVGHALVVLTLQSDRGSLADQLCEKIWPVLSEMFAPWITPYWTRNLREPTAAWIQQLTDDRSILLPWIIADGPYANRTVAMFIECVRFITDTMPASSKILCYLWQFYVTNFAHASIKDHVLNVIHGNFLSLPWERFSPGINDVEFMIKVVDQYLPDSHLFLGSVFTIINWPLWINEMLSVQPLTVSARMHVCLLNLLVKLSNEPNVRQNDKAVKLMEDAEKFAWHLVDASSFDQVINWHVMSCDPRVILSIENEIVHPIDIAVNNLLKVVAAYDPTVTHFHPTTLKKRQIYVRSCMKLLTNCTSRHKALLSTNLRAFTNALSNMLDELEAVITSTVSEPQQTAEAGLLVTELLLSVNQNGVLADHLKISWTSWLSKRTGNNPIVIGILRVIGVAIASPSILGDIMEAALEAYFRQNVIEDVQPSWAAVLSVLQSLVPRQPPVEGVLVAEGKPLALYAILLKKLPSCRDIREEGMLLTNLIDWITAIKPMESFESKLPLLWAKVLELIYRQCQYSENMTVAIRALKGLARALLTIADDAGQGWGILGAIGIRKGSQISIRCKYLSRAISVYCLAQMPESKSEQQVVRFTPHSPGVAPLRSNDSDLMEIRPSTDAVKAMQTLEALLINKQYLELKGDIEQAIRLIRDSANSLHNAVAVVGTLTGEIYNQRYLHVLTD
ncbi:ectopic P granules protein 5 homolog isoform X2 [Leptopilina boulardi]|uniref:ectopic P granules protein 5 homolog isoform X2 n=1 Tax=Leptopilina boulardi TaxID=63433 RepID=UPI0021F66550|nr:ectopic P granules protein 5 homolog isoform X2 [Leptopilina boulardi]